MTALAHVLIRRRRWIVAAWVVLTLFGAYAAGAVSSRWLEQFSIPGYSAYEANQRALKTFGTGAQAPHVAVFTSKGDVTRRAAWSAAIAGCAADSRATRVGSYFSTGSDAYVSRDRHTTFATIYPPGTPGFGAETRTRRDPRVAEGGRARRVSPCTSPGATRSTSRRVATGGPERAHRGA